MGEDRGALADRSFCFRFLERLKQVMSTSTYLTYPSYQEGKALVGRAGLRKGLNT